MSANCRRKPSTLANAPNSEDAGKGGGEKTAHQQPAPPAEARGLRRGEAPGLALCALVGALFWVIDRSMGAAFGAVLVAGGAV